MKTMSHRLPRSLWIVALLVALTRACYGFEPFFVVNTTPGVTTGIPLGANPPPGFYFINFANGGRSTIQGIGASTGLDSFKVNSMNEAGVLWWSTPWTVLGASWAVLAVVPATAATLYDPAGAVVARINGAHNTGFSPAMLSWNLGSGFFTKLGVIVWSPNGNITLGPLDNGLANIGAPYWTIEPHFAVSYLGNDWNLTANFIFGISTRNSYSGVTNGTSMNLDLTATKKFGQFELGPIAYLSTQISPDSGCDAFYGPGVCARGTKSAVGGLIGYDFGAFTVRLAATDAVYVRNSFDGWRMWSQVIFKLWTAEPPPAPKPVRAKY